MHEETVKIVDAQVGEMAIQMSALDGFVTRARCQNDEMLEEHIGGLLQLSLQVAQLQTEVSQSIDERDTDLQSFQKDAHAATEDLSGTAENLKLSVASSISTLRKGFEEAALQEYVPTAETPQKRDWAYPTELPETANHLSVIANARGLPDPTIGAKTPGAARTPGRSPKKQISPRKGSPFKAASPTKTKVFNDELTRRVPLKSSHEDLTQPLKELKEIDINVIARPASAAEESHTLAFSRSVGHGQPPLKRHATADGMSRVPTKNNRTPKARGVENLGQSIGPGRRLRSSQE